jgi:hypothetical protein
VNSTALSLLETKPNRLALEAEIINKRTPSPLEEETSEQSRKA